jgi:hypothetical protein
MRPLNLFLILAFSTLLATGMASAGQDQGSYCAFEVSVKSPAGAPVVGWGVAGLSETGEIFETTTTDEHGIARICDAPPGMVSIRVGGQFCGAVTVRNLNPWWMTTREVFVTYQSCANDAYALPGGCVLTLRLHDKDGLPLPGVLFQKSGVDHTSWNETNTSDQFGRIFRFIEWGNVLRGTLVKVGYTSKDVTEECKAGQQFKRYQVVILNKRAPE